MTTNDAQLVISSFAEFRSKAREALAAGRSPQQVDFRDATLDPGTSFLGGTGTLFELPPPAKHPLNVTREFLAKAEAVGASNSANKWNLLYRLLWRLQFENHSLLEIVTDDDVLEFESIAKAVKREIHKVHAFVRFEKKSDDVYFAWMKTDHPCLELAAPFFARRFGDRKWTIATQWQAAHWNLETLAFGPGLAKAPERMDELDDLWKSYYSSIFNPARVKIPAMKKEMPARYWDALPEADLIRDLLREAPERVRRMAREQRTSAKPPATTDLEVLREAAKGCRGCPLWEKAHHTVFGEGPKQARVMIVGEQPGDLEDVTGKPFVGPAGDVLDRAIEFAGLDRREIYLTNAVKHFKWKPGPPRKPRLHQTANGSEMQACKPWLEREIEAIKPHVIVALGATAALSILGKRVRISEELDLVHVDSSYAPVILVSYHPSAVLRATTSEERVRIESALRKSLGSAANFALGAEPTPATSFGAESGPYGGSS